MISDRIAAIWNGPGLQRELGMDLRAAGPEGAELRLTLSERHLNLQGMAHGGTIFALADVALGMAANAGPERAVTQEAQIHYVSPAHPGEVLTARSTLLSRHGRTGLYDVRVTAQDGRLVAALRGQARFLGTAG